MIHGRPAIPDTLILRQEFSRLFAAVAQGHAGQRLGFVELYAEYAPELEAQLASAYGAGFGGVPGFDQGFGELAAARVAAGPAVDPGQHGRQGVDERVAVDVELFGGPQYGQAEYERYGA